MSTLVATAAAPDLSTQAAAQQLERIVRTDAPALVPAATPAKWVARKTQSSLQTRYVSR